MGEEVAAAAGERVWVLSVCACADTREVGGWSRGGVFFVAEYGGVLVFLQRRVEVTVSRYGG